MDEQTFFLKKIQCRDSMGKMLVDMVTKGE